MANQKKCSVNKYVIKFIYYYGLLFHLALTKKIFNYTQPILIYKYGCLVLNLSNIFNNILLLN